MKILLIEDDEVLAEVLVNALTSEHYAVDVAPDGQIGWDLASSFAYDLILLDVVLPKLDGISLCRQLRSHGNPTPILLLTAQDASTSKVVGLDAGADDYMTKPFDQQELLARIRALQRREAVTLQPILTWEKLSLDPSTREVTHQGEPIYLRPREYDLLELLLRNPHRVFRRGAILDHLWSFEGTPGEETVTAHIKGLRRHLEAAGVSHDPIETVYGIGYRLRPETPVQKPLETSVADQANTATSDIWERAKQKLSHRIAVIERATSASIADALADDLRHEAEQEAHKLAGSLGMFNFDQGSQLAHKAEQVLRNWPQLPSPERTQLADLVEELRRSVQQALNSETPTLFSTQLDVQPPLDSPLAPFTHTPTLLLISPDVVFHHALATAAADSATSWVIQAETDAIAAQANLAHSPPDVVLLDLSGLSSDAKTTQLSPDIETLLIELQRMVPAVPLLLRTHPNALLDRVKIAQLGGRGLIPSSLPAVAVIETVRDMWVRSRPQAATVLVVDDDPQILDAMGQLLEPWGLTVFVLDDPRRFWPVLNETQPDLLVLDVEMPYMDGLALCQVVRSDLNWSHVPVLFLTAHTDTTTKHRVFEVGADDYVPKPIVGPELVTRILNRLERSQLGQSRTQIDALSGTANRHHANQIIDQRLNLARQHHQPLCLAALKVDHLDQINRQYGYDLGDGVLIHLGQQLRQIFDGDDVVGRWGGRIFIVAMYGMNAQDGLRRLKQVLTAFRRVALPIDETIKHHNKDSRIGFSAGIVTYPEIEDRATEDWPTEHCSTLVARAIAILDQAQPGHILSS